MALKKIITIVRFCIIFLWLSLYSIGIKAQDLNGSSDSLISNTQALDTQPASSLPIDRPLPAPSRAQLFPVKDSSWRRNVLRSMPLEEKIGQLFMIPAYSNTAKFNRAYVEKMINFHKVGGIIFMQGNPKAQAELANYYQSISPLPLLVGQDAEWGLSMRLDSVERLPRNMALGAIQTDSLIYAYGRELARQCKEVGVHINFAPVLDVNNNPMNPVINDRSFGENKYNVARKGLSIIQGLQDHGVMASAKHFPGHGDTDVDSHYDLPTISHERPRLDSIELYPFREAIRYGVQSIMIAHLYVPALDTSKGIPTTLSKKTITCLLRDSLGFDGLIFTDALNMGAVSKNFKPGEMELAALLAGNDVLLFSENIPQAIQAIKKAITVDSILTEAELDAHVERILAAKEWLHLHHNRFIKVEGVTERLNNAQFLDFKRQLYIEALTLVRNDSLLLPLTNLEYRHIACVQIGVEQETAFAKTLKRYSAIDTYMLPKYAKPEQVDSLVDKLKAYNTIIYGIFNNSRLPKHFYGLDDSTINFLKRAESHAHHSIVTYFGNAYGLQYVSNPMAILLGYEEAVEAQEAAAEVIFGGRKPVGVLPCHFDSRFNEQTIFAEERATFRTEKPEFAGLSSDKLSKIDTIVTNYIRQKAMPGCAILAIKGNNIVYQKGFGSTDYENNTASIDPLTTIYDLASITKVASTTLAAMRLYERNALELDKTISHYVPDIQGKIGKIKIRELLEHQSGLPAWYPFWKTIITSNNKPDPTFVSTTTSDTFNIPLSPDLYLHRNFPSQMWALIESMEVNEDKPLVYSDINMILLGKVIEEIVQMPIESYVTETFYEPLGMNYTYFNPALKCVPVTIAPTEDDKRFRFTKVQGYVHDEAAALLGGCAGHAGLFSNVYDLGKLLLMLKNGGVYNGRRFLKAETIKKFTSPSSKNSRRGLGWDKPDTRPMYLSPASKKASAEAFGHLGFTGTSIWVDPVYDLIYVFLTNRTYPDPNNTLFVQESVRIKVMDVLYEAMEYFKKNYD